jgi:hypothetical protein
MPVVDESRFREEDRPCILELVEAHRSGCIPSVGARTRIKYLAREMGARGMAGGCDYSAEVDDSALKALIVGDVTLSAHWQTTYLHALENAVRDTGAGTLVQFLTEPARYQRELRRARGVDAPTSTFRDVATAACAVFRRHTEFACQHKDALKRWEANEIVLAKHVEKEMGELKDQIASLEKEKQDLVSKNERMRIAIEALPAGSRRRIKAMLNW